MRQTVIAMLVIGMISPTRAMSQAREGSRVQAAAVTWILRWKIPQQRLAVASACIAAGIVRSIGPGLNAITDRHDIDSAALALISSDSLPIRPASACVDLLDRNSYTRTVEAETGRHAVSIAVSLPQFVDPDHAKVDVNFRMAALWAEGFYCVAVRKENIWVIQSCTQAWIS